MQYTSNISDEKLSVEHTLERYFTDYIIRFKDEVRVDDSGDWKQISYIIMSEIIKWVSGS